MQNHDLWKVIFPQKCNLNSQWLDVMTWRSKKCKIETTFASQHWQRGIAASCFWRPSSKWQCRQVGGLSFQKPSFQNWPGSSICQYHLHRPLFTMICSWPNVGPSLLIPPWEEIRLVYFLAKASPSSTPATTWGLRIQQTHTKDINCIK